MNYSSAFEFAFKKLMLHEGAYANDPDDPGGETHYGISKRSYPEVDIKNLTIDQAKEIYHYDWWLKYNYPLISNGILAAKVFDHAVNMGQKRAAICLQKAINRLWKLSLTEDGIIGPRTQAAITSLDNQSLAGKLYRMYCHEVARYYESLHNEKYERGWLLRAMD